MAQGWIVSCDVCHMSFEAWEDGNPWFIDVVQLVTIAEDGSVIPRSQKKYCHHPQPWPTFFLASGNDVKHLCLDCGRKFYCDVSELEEKLGRERPLCIKCGGDNVYGVCQLRGKPCPKCREGVFGVDETSFMIS